MAISSRKEQKTWQEAIEYVALNDEPTILSVKAMTAYASVQAVAVVFGKTPLAVAGAVVRWRKDNPDA